MRTPVLFSWKWEGAKVCGGGGAFFFFGWDWGGGCSGVGGEGER